MSRVGGWVITAVIVIGGAFGLFVAISGFVQSGPGWALVGLLILAFTVCLEMWVHRTPSIDQLIDYGDGGDEPAER
jgi:hypothetical protein